MKRTRFNIQIDEGPERYFTSGTGIYRDAAAAIPAMLGVDLPFVVKIWVERLLPQYGPHYYRVREDAYGNLLVEHVVPANGQYEDRK